MSNRLSAAALALLALGACKETKAPNRKAPASRDLPIVAHLDTSCLAGASHKTGSLAWFEDDYTAAATCAMQLNRPLVVDLWAPWCHTCLSMREYVFPDPGLAPLADRFVFVGIDTDRPENADAVARLPPVAWPTFYVISDSSTVQARYVGSASIAQFREFLVGGERAHLARQSNSPDLGNSADAQLIAADRLSAAGDLAGAERGYAAVLAVAAPDWPRRPDVLVNQIGARFKLGNLAGCLELADATIPQLAKLSSRSDFISYALACATQVTEPPAPDAAAPLDDAARKALAPLIASVRKAAIASLGELAADLDAPLSVDDRSDALMYLREAQLASGDKTNATKTARQQQALLDGAATSAASPEVASTYNWPRAEVYVFLGEPLALVPALEKSAADLPTAYDPPHRLAWIYFKAGKLVEAKVWVDKALALAYGNRKDRIQKLADDIAAASAQP